MRELARERAQVLGVLIQAREQGRETARDIAELVACAGVRNCRIDHVAIVGQRSFGGPLQSSQAHAQECCERQAGKNCEAAGEQSQIEEPRQCLAAQGKQPIAGLFEQQHTTRRALANYRHRYREQDAALVGQSKPQRRASAIKRRVDRSSTEAIQLRSAGGKAFARLKHSTVESIAPLVARLAHRFVRIGGAWVPASPPRREPSRSRRRRLHACQRAAGARVPVPVSADGTTSFPVGWCVQPDRGCRLEPATHRVLRRRQPRSPGACPPSRAGGGSRADSPLCTGCQKAWMRGSITSRRSP